MCADATSVAAEAGAPPEGVDAAWLSKSLLLVVGNVHLVDPGQTRALLVAGDDAFGIGVRCISLGAGNGRPERKLLTVVLDGERSAPPAAESLSMRGDAEDESPAIELRLRDLGSIATDRLSGLREGTAARVIEFISEAPVAHGLGDERDLVLSSKLHNLRNALRHRLPEVVIQGDQALSANVDTLVPIDECTFFVRGWIRDGEARTIRLTALTPEGERIELLEQVFRLDLPQFEMFADGPYKDPVDATRFIAHFETARPSRLRKPWVFEIENETGRAVEMYALPEVGDVAVARSKVLSSVPESALPDERLMADHVHPAIARLQERARESIEVANVADYGEPPESPEVSIVVPLYQRIDLVEHQLLQFNRDPELKAAELIYVLDSPDLENALADRARQLVRLYDVPFKVVTMAHNVGFGAATNAGVAAARARLLLLLNSDVLPAEAGWLGSMREFYDSTSDIGALGPKLLYEDDSLQHAGLYFDIVQEGPTAGSWANMHYFKGLHKDLPAANVARPVPAVTAACLMVEKDLYERVGGMPDVYVQGDYEDSELCLRLLAEDRDNWYLPAVALYHLEGSSYSDKERGMTGSYNRWLQTHRNGPAIEAAMSRYARI